MYKRQIHYRNGLSESEEPDPQTVSEFEERYKTILSIAGDEYDYEPVSYTHLNDFLNMDVLLFAKNEDLLNIFS